MGNSRNTLDGDGEEEASSENSSLTVTEDEESEEGSSEEDMAAIGAGDDGLGQPGDLDASAVDDAASPAEKAEKDIAM